MRILLIVTIGGLLTTAASGQTTTDSGIDAKIRAFNDLLRTSGPPPGYTYVQTVPSYQSRHNRNDEQNEENQIQQAMDRYHASEVIKAGNAVIDAIRADNAAYNKSKHDAVMAVLNRIHDTLQNAQKPEDLDQLTQDLSNVMPAEHDYGESDATRLDTVLPYIDHYQDYLAQIQSGNTQTALQSLHTMEDVHVDGVTLLPRSFIQEKIAALEKQGRPASSSGKAPQPEADTTFKAIRSIDDLQSAAEKMTSPGNEMGNTPDAQRLKEYASLCAQAKNGLPVNFTFAQANYGYGPTASPEMARIQSMVVLYLLPLYLGTTAPAPNTDETVTAYLDRLTSTAESAQNWPLLQRVVMARIKMQAPNGGAAMGAQSFLAGLSEEIASQFDQAVASYQAALKAPDDVTPLTVIGDRLAAIKKDHPGEYEKGLQLVDPRTSFMPGFRPSPVFQNAVTTPTDAAATRSLKNPLRSRKTSAPTETNPPPAPASVAPAAPEKPAKAAGPGVD